MLSESEEFINFIYFSAFSKASSFKSIGLSWISKLWCVDIGLTASIIIDSKLRLFSNLNWRGRDPNVDAFCREAEEAESGAPAAGGMNGMMSIEANSMCDFNW